MDPTLPNTLNRTAANFLSLVELENSKYEKLFIDTMLRIKNTFNPITQSTFVFIPLTNIDPNLVQMYPGQVAFVRLSHVFLQTSSTIGYLAINEFCDYSNHAFHERITTIVYSLCSTFTSSQLQLVLIDMGSNVHVETIHKLLILIEKLINDAEIYTFEKYKMKSERMFFILFPFYSPVFDGYANSFNFASKLENLMNKKNVMIFASAGNENKNLDESYNWPMSTPHTFEQMVVVGIVKNSEKHKFVSNYCHSRTKVNIYLESHETSTALVATRILQVAVTKYLLLENKSSAKTIISSNLQLLRSPLITLQNIRSMLNE